MGRSGAPVPPGTPPASPSPSKASFAPVVDAATRVLILGSLPGEVSLARQQYYANPRNQFWALMSAVLETPLPEAYGERLAALLAAGVGLWDVIRTAERTGSLDADIRNPEPNALRELVGTLPALRAVAFNGGKASAVGRKALGAVPGLALISLPSSSPAHAALSFERKRAAWLKLRPFVGIGAAPPAA